MQGDATPLSCSTTVIAAALNEDQKPSPEGWVETAGILHCGAEMNQTNAQAQNSRGEERSGLMCTDSAVRS